MTSTPSSPPPVHDKPIPMERRPSTNMPVMSVDTSHLNLSTVADPHIPPQPTTISSPSTNVNGGWFETRQALQKDMSTDDDLNGHKTVGGFSIRSGLVAYLALTLTVLVYESVYIILYFSGVVSDGLEIAATQADSSEERNFLIDLEAKQQGWLTAQLIWYSLGILFCFYGFVVFYLERLVLFKVFHAWLIVHIFAYFIAATVFEQFSPIVLQTPGYVTLVIFIAALNVYAGYLAGQYKRRLMVLAEQNKFYSSRPKIGDIGGPV